LNKEKLTELLRNGIKKVHSHDLWISGMSVL